MKNISHIVISILCLTFVFGSIVSTAAYPKKVSASTPCTAFQRAQGICQDTIDAVADPTKNTAADFKENPPQPDSCGIAAPFCWIMKIVTKVAGSILLKLTGLLTQLAGVALNSVVFYTVVQMAHNFTKITAINDAWEVVRDIANMAFIFVLLYAAIQMILGNGKDTRHLIVNMIVAAILINFSLFFTKVIIDVANLLALTFYSAIAPGATAADGAFKVLDMGISNAFLNILNLQTLWSAPNVITEGSIITVGILGSVVLLITAFVFFAIAAMFLVRFVVLMLVLILSPLMFVAMILPQLKKYTEQWWDALIGQAFFAPVYFFMTWIVLTLLTGLAGQIFNSPDPNITQSQSWASALTGTIKVSGSSYTTSYESGAINLIIFFGIVIIALIASLIAAKNVANRMGGEMGKITSWATGMAGGATFGMAGRLGRNTIGRRASSIANDEELKAKAARGDVGARLKLATASKLARSSFDMRATAIGKPLDAGKAQKGGFVQDQKDRAKRYEEVYKPNANAKKDAEAEKDLADAKLKEAEELAKNEVDTAVPKNRELESAEKAFANAQKESYTPDPATGFDPVAAAAFETSKKAKVEAARKKVEQEETKQEEMRKAYIESRVAKSKEYETVMSARAKFAEMDTRMASMAYRAENRAPVNVAVPFTKERVTFGIPGSGIFTGGKAQAAAIRAADKGKSATERLADAAAQVVKEQGGEQEGTKTEEKKEGEAEKKPEENKT